MSDDEFSISYGKYEPKNRYCFYRLKAFYRNLFIDFMIDLIEEEISF